MKKTFKQIKNNNGITLIALIITIIVLVILAGVTVTILTGDNGLLTKVGHAKNTSELSTEKEKIQLEVTGAYDTSGRLVAKNIVTNINNNISDATAEATSDSFPIKITYSNGHKYGILENGDIIENLIGAGETAPNNSNAIYSSGKYTAVIPAGFTVSNVVGETAIDTGLVIKDNNDNEFVWIPVKIPWKTDSKKTIALGRYVFDDNGNLDTTLSKSNPQDQLKTSSTNTIYFTEGLKYSQTSNTHAKDINDFISRTNAVGGFWIGRYEARTVTLRSKKDDELTQVTEKASDYVYNYITQPQAAKKAQEMYTSDYFESDLINSYAWDTATLFLQEYDNRTDAIRGNSNYIAKYSRQIKLSSG